MNDIGEFTLLVSLATAIYGCVAYVMAARGNRIDLYLSADKTPVIVWGCVMISSICLWKAFLTNDFSLQYVWAYTMKKFSTKQKDRCKTFTTALRYIYFIISGTEGIVDINPECEKKNKSKAPWFKKKLAYKWREMASWRIC